MQQVHLRKPVISSNLGRYMDSSTPCSQSVDLGTSLHEPLLSPLPRFWLCDKQTFYPAHMPSYTTEYILQTTNSSCATVIEVAGLMGGSLKDSSCLASTHQVPAVHFATESWCTMLSQEVEHFCYREDFGAHGHCSRPDTAT